MENSKEITSKSFKGESDKFMFESRNRLKESLSMNENLMYFSSDESDNEEHQNNGESDGEGHQVYDGEKLRLIALELFETEKSYETFLKTLYERIRVKLGIATIGITKDQAQAQISMIEFDEMFNPIEIIHECSKLLVQTLKPRIEKWDKLPRLADVFQENAPHLRHYMWFLNQFEKFQQDIIKKRKKYILFDQLLETLEEEHFKGIKIEANLVRIMHRIVQYREILRRYKKALNSSTDEIEKKNTEESLKIILDILNRSNEMKKEPEKCDKMMDIQVKLGTQYSIMKTGRELLKEGDLEKLSKKCPESRKCLLFNDLLLVISLKMAGSYRFHRALTLDSIQVEKSIKVDYQNEFNIYSSEKSFTFSCRSDDEADAWIASIHEAQVNLPETHPDDVEPTSPKKLGYHSPVMILDERTTQCCLCSIKFTTINRRHHCRACGWIFCGKCSSSQAPLPYKSYKSKRVCEICYNRLKYDFNDLQNTDLPDGLKHDFVKRRFRTSVKSPDKWTCPIFEGGACIAGVHGHLEMYMDGRWKNRWVVLNKYKLYCYLASEDKFPENTFDIISFRPSSDKNENMEFIVIKKDFNSQIVRVPIGKNPSKWRESIFYVSDVRD